MGQLIAEISVASVEAMIWRFARARFRGRDELFLETVVQDVRGYLVTDCLPKFDIARGKESTFLFGCIRRRLGAIARQENRRPATLPGAMPAADRRADRAVYQLAHEVATRPEEFLTLRQAQVLRAVMQRPEPRREIAAQLGLDLKSLSAILLRIRKRLLALLDDCAIP